MENERFNDLLKQTIDEHDPVPAPDEARIWSGIRSGISRNSDRRRHWWHAAAAAVLFCSGLALGHHLASSGEAAPPEHLSAEVQRTGSAFLASLSRARHDAARLDRSARDEVREVSLGVVKGAAAELLHFDPHDPIALTARQLSGDERRRIAASESSALETEEEF